MVSLTSGRLAMGEILELISQGQANRMPSCLPCLPHLRKLYEPLFVKWGVSVVFNGHDHSYQRRLAAK